MDETRKLRTYPDYYEWSKDRPELAKMLRVEVVEALAPYDPGPRELDNKIRDRWAEMVLEEMEADGLVYKQDGAYLLTEKGRIEA